MKRSALSVLAPVLVYLVASASTVIVVGLRVDRNMLESCDHNGLAAGVRLYVGAGVCAGAVWFIGALLATRFRLGTPRGWGLLALLLEGLTRPVLAYVPESALHYILMEFTSAFVALGVALSAVAWCSLAFLLGAYVGIYLSFLKRHDVDAPGYAMARARRAIMGIVAPLVFVTAGVCILGYGNPQWHRMIYLFQARVWTGRIPEMPKYYTGVWRRWARDDGELLREAEYKYGVLNGMERRWDNGKLWKEAEYEDGVTVMVRWWNDDGTPSEEREHYEYDWEPVVARWWTDDGRLFSPTASHWRARYDTFLMALRRCDSRASMLRHRWYSAVS